MVHAEVNAILNKIGNVSGTSMYVYGSFPCNECAKIIIQAGIQEIVYVDNTHKYNGNGGIHEKSTSCNDDEITATCDNKMKASRIGYCLD